jgi:hypothetical protein
MSDISKGFSIEVRERGRYWRSAVVATERVSADAD